MNSGVICHIQRIVTTRAFVTAGSSGNFGAFVTSCISEGTTVYPAMYCKAYHCCLKNKIVLEGTPNTVAVVFEVG